MKSLKTAILAVSLILATAVHAEGNPYRQSYGTWEAISPDGAERFVIGKHGFEKFAHVAPNCRNKKNGYLHQADWISGKALAQDIRESMEDDAENEAYARPLRNILKKISPSKKYLQIGLSLSCADGYTAFIQITPNEALKLEAAPDGFYTPVRRVK
ncbi:transcriptional regulator [Kingella sp. (in: b-proteobacteria)]|uniref:transcriptional regulator n=1 Tax=Kingella sp. (in: b-proteobacteria) TaxID=2020713 RepID=UPI0026DB4B86|nr:transcriptional regulator [Kingella sp. (in: b-proteobacteria)]MDO4658428.1 transcriptional regulator [Kingella sp. (in: b-proteobacteria)]